MLEKVSPDHRLIFELFDKQPDAVVWLTPVFKSNDPLQSIEDFEVRYCNAAAAHLSGANSFEIVGLTILTSPFMDAPTKEDIFEQCLHVWHTHEPIEFNYYSAIQNKHFNAQRSKVMDGILSVTRDKTSEVIAEQKRSRQSLLLEKIINNSPACIVNCQAVRNEEGKIVDFRFLMVNNKVARYNQLSKEEIYKTTYGTLYPEVVAEGLLDIFTNVIETGTSYNDEIYLKKLGGWFHLSVDKLDDEQVVATYLDINESKSQQARLVRQADWYNNVLRYSSNGIVVLKSVRDNSHQIIDFEIVMCNPSGMTMGRLPHNAVGQKLCELHPELKSNGYFEMHRHVVETGQSCHTTLPFQRDDQQYWFQVSLAKLDDGLVSNFIDVTEIKQRERTIQDQAALLDLMLNSSINGIYSLTAVRNTQNEVIDFVISHVNDLFCKMSGKTKEHLIGRSFSEVFPDTRKTGIFQRNCHVLETGEESRRETRYKGDGVDRWYDSSVRKAGNDKIVISFNDVTPLKQAAVQLEQYNDELMKSNKRLQEFTYIASHDLKEPLRKIMAYTELLNQRHADSLSPEVSEYFTRIVKTAGRMQTLINDLLKYSRVSSRIGESENLSLTDIVNEVETDLESLMQNKNVWVESSVLPIVKGDKTQLQQVFQNLISNAIKFQSGHHRPHVQICQLPDEIKDGKEYVVIEVCDNGIGIEASQREKIFQLFHRLHGRSEYEGTGIGLAIVKRAMENHHGFITVHDNKQGPGTCFRLLFPKVY